jgi:hypothetical protein
LWRRHSFGIKSLDALNCRYERRPLVAIVTSIRLAVGGAVATDFRTASGPRGTAFVSGSSSAVPMQNLIMLQVAGKGGTTDDMRMFSRRP